MKVTCGNFQIFVIIFSISKMPIQQDQHFQQKQMRSKILSKIKSGHLIKDIRKNYYSIAQVFVIDYKLPVESL